MSYTTPAELTLDEGIYEVTVPQTFSIGGVQYNFVAWSTGETSLTKTVNLTSDITISAIYLEQYIYEITPPVIRLWVGLDRPTKIIKVTTASSRHVKAEKPYHMEIKMEKYVRHVLIL